jgi:hypothetical protein
MSDDKSGTYLNLTLGVDLESNLPFVNGCRAACFARVSGSRGNADLRKD